MLIGGGLITAFYIIDTSRTNSTDINTEAEGNFLIRKFEWIMNGASSAVISDAGPSSGITLTVVKGGTTYVLRLNGANLELDGVILNSSLIVVTTVGGAVFTTADPDGIKMAFNVNGKEFSTAKHLRK